MTVGSDASETPIDFRDGLELGEVVSSQRFLLRNQHHGRVPSPRQTAILAMNVIASRRCVGAVISFAERLVGRRPEINHGALETTRPNVVEAPEHPWSGMVDVVDLLGQRSRGNKLYPRLCPRSVGQQVHSV